MKSILKIAALLLSAFFFGACSNEETDEVQTKVMTKSATEIQNLLYVEVNDINPLNAGSYTFSSGKAYFTHVIIFAANIRGVNGKATLYNNPNVQAILSGKAKYIQPLQQKGIKVLLSILGDHTGLGVANMNDAQVEDFATQVANAVETYNLDGIEIDDEWAEYGKGGYPSSSTGSLPKLVKKLKEKMGPDKTIVVFDYGSNVSELSTVSNYVDYGLNAFFGTYNSTPSMGLSASNWAGYAINLNNYNSPTSVETYAAYTAADGLGAICYYDLRKNDISETLNHIAPICFGDVVIYDGISYNKDW